MRRTLRSHPYKDEVVGGVNSYAVAFSNWVFVSLFIWLGVWLMTGEMSGSDQNKTTKPVGSGLVYAVPTQINPERVGGIGYTPIPSIKNATPTPTQSTGETPTNEVGGHFFTPTPPPLHFPTLAPPRTEKWYMVGYSYYNPALLGENCLLEKDGICVSPLAHGEKWIDKIDKKVIAVPPRWITNGLTTLGGQIEILYPPQIMGVYDVLDICSGCDKAYWTEYDGMDRIDILASEQALVWAHPIVLIFLDTLAQIEGTVSPPLNGLDLSSPP